MVVLGDETADESDWVMVDGIIGKGLEGPVKFSALLNSSADGGRDGIAGWSWVRCRLLELVASTSTAVGLELQLTGCAGVDVQGSTQLARLGSDRGTWLAEKGGVERR